MGSDFREKLLLLFVGFVLTGIVGASINHLYQNAEDERQYKLKRLDYKIQRADKLRENLSVLLDSRTYAMTRLEQALTQKNETTIEARFQAYDRALVDWNQNLNRMLAETSIIFPGRAYDMLSIDIQEKGFIPAGVLLEAKYRAFLDGSLLVKTEDDFKKLKNSMHSLRINVYTFNVLLENQYTKLLEID